METKSHRVKNKQLIKSQTTGELIKYYPLSGLTSVHWTSAQPLIDLHHAIFEFYREQKVRQLSMAIRLSSNSRTMELNQETNLTENLPNVAGYKITSIAYLGNPVNSFLIPRQSAHEPSYLSLVYADQTIDPSHLIKQTSYHPNTNLLNITTRPYRVSSTPTIQRS